MEVGRDCAQLPRIRHSATVRMTNTMCGSDCARRRRVDLAADTQFVVKLSGDCRRKWLDIRFGVAAVRCTSKRERFPAAVFDLVNSHTFAKGHGSRWFLLQYRKYPTKRRGRLVRTPIPYIHDCASGGAMLCATHTRLHKTYMNVAQAAIPLYNGRPMCVPNGYIR